MLTTCSQRPRRPLERTPRGANATTHARQHRSPEFRKILASAACAMLAALISAGVTRPAAAPDGVQPPPYDRRVLSEIARDVLRNGATGANQSVADPSLPGRTQGLKP